MLREMLNKVVGKERQANELTGAHYDELETVADGMNELELRDYASNSGISEAVAYNTTLVDLLKWYKLYKTGQINV